MATRRGKSNRKTSRRVRGWPTGRVVQGIQRSLLEWFEANGRAFSWRRDDVTPFAVLITEILLTKTRAEAAEPVAAQVLSRYPTPEKLADANPETLAKLLYPLGLHEKRARGLVNCARMIVDTHRGVVPSTTDELEALPHVGRYAANAVACVAFGQRVGVIDANVERIFRRAFSLRPPPARLSTAHELWRLADLLVPAGRAKEYNWSLLDLGSMICTPKTPDCSRCPIAPFCRSAVTPERPVRRGPLARARSNRAT